MYDRIPHDSNGPADRALAGAGTTNLQAQVRSIFADLLERTDVELDDNFFTLGGTTRLASLVGTRIEGEIPGARTCIRASPAGFASLFLDRPTVRATAAFLEGTPVQHALLRCLREGDANVAPIFWNHGMFNGDGVYAWELAGEIPPEVPFYVLHPHGVDNTPFSEDVGELADDHLRLIRSVRPHGPYRLGGYCNGALLMYEIAVRLRAAGEIVETPVFVGLPPLRPLAERLGPLGERLSQVLTLDQYGAAKFRRAIRMLVERVHRGGRPAIELPAGYRGAGDDPFADRYYKIKRYMNAIASYEVPNFDGKLALIYGQGVYPHTESEAGWSRYVSDLSVHVIPGAHFAASENPSDVGAIFARVLAANAG